jgi:CRP/FNR family transcriptional regulator, dissimilatory nitrate respiration regulator
MADAKSEASKSARKGAALDWLPSVLRARAPTRTLANGQALFRQGDPVIGLFQVSEGRIRLVRHTPDDHLVVLHIAGPGALFAEAALFSDTYHCDAIAAASTRVRVFPKEEIRAAFRQDAALAERFMAVLAREVQALRARLEQRGIRSARDRVLQSLALGAGPDCVVHLDAPLTEFAAELGLTHEALYRTLAGLQRDGVITRTKNRIVIKNPPKA